MNEVQTVTALIVAGINAKREAMQSELNAKLVLLQSHLENNTRSIQQALKRDYVQDLIDDPSSKTVLQARKSLEDAHALSEVIQEAIGRVDISLDQLNIEPDAHISRVQTLIASALRIIENVDVRRVKHEPILPSSIEVLQGTRNAIQQIIEQYDLLTVQVEIEKLLSIPEEYTQSEAA